MPEGARPTGVELTALPTAEICETASEPLSATQTEPAPEAIPAGAEPTAMSGSALPATTLNGVTVLLPRFETQILPAPYVMPEAPKPAKPAGVAGFGAGWICTPSVLPNAAQTPGLPIATLPASPPETLTAPARCRKVCAITFRFGSTWATTPRAPSATQSAR